MANIIKIDADGNYWCNRCKTFKSLEQFYKVSPSQRGNRSPHCKECSTELAYIQRHRQRVKKLGSEEYLKELTQDKKMLEERYKILDEYNKKEPK